MFSQWTIPQSIAQPNSKLKCHPSGNKLRNIDGFVQDCGNSIANALELPKPCTKPSILPADARKVKMNSVRTTNPTNGHISIVSCQKGPICHA